MSGMIFRNFRSLFFCGICFAGILLILAGCGKKDYKNQTDTEVYNIIDQKWDESFGKKANYRISDVEPAADSIVLDKWDPSSEALTLARAVSIATCNSREYNIEKENLYLSALNLTGVRHFYENSYFGSARGYYRRDEADETVEGGGEAGLNRLFTGGAILSAHVASAWLEVLSGTAVKGLSSVFNTTLSVPLLRGSKKEIVRESLTQAERDTLYQLRFFNRFRKTFAVSIISEYYRILELFEVMKSAEFNYLKVSEVCDLGEHLAGAGRLPISQLERAKQEKLLARANYFDAKKEYEEFLDIFKTLLTLPPETELRLDPNELKLLSDVGSNDPCFSEMEAIETALAGRLDLANSFDAVDDAERKIAVAADALRMGLNLFVSGNWRRHAHYSEYVVQIELTQLK